MRVLPLLLFWACALPDPSVSPVSNPSDDLDGDGFSADDCDDTDRSRNPDAPELCDGVDNDCDGQIDDNPIDRATYHRDQDGDGFGDPNHPERSCTRPDGYVQNAADCDDGNPNRNPATAWYVDADGDGYGSLHDVVFQCERPDGYVRNPTDCNDERPYIHPDVPEVCNGRDDDCDGKVDDADDSVGQNLATFYEDADGDGYGSPDSTLEACAPSGSFIANDGDCNDGDAAVFPGAVETCSTPYADSCTATDPWPVGALGCEYYYKDADADGFGAAGATRCLCADDPDKGLFTASAAGDCNDATAIIHPGAPERCGGADEDCDPSTGDASVTLENQLVWYFDDDSDDFGTETQTVTGCERPPNYAALAGDCDDADRDVNPGEIESCDGLDNDCDPATTEDGLISRSGKNYSSLAGALSSDSGQVALCPGTYPANLVLTNSTTLQGFGDPDSIVLDGSGGGATITVGDHSLSLTALTVANGKVHNESGFTTLTDVRITDSHDPSGDGGAYFGGSGSTLFATESLFDQNSADRGGGLFLASGSSATLEDCDIDANDARLGGGIASAVDLTVPSKTTARLSGNAATGSGGGVYQIPGQVIALERLVATGNSATTGGGFWLDGAGCLNCESYGNTADNGAGLYAFGNVTLTNPIVTGNFAKISGGGASAIGLLVVNNGILNENSSALGGNLYVAGRAELTSGELKGTGAGSGIAMGQVPNVYFAAQSVAMDLNSPHTVFFESTGGGQTYTGFVTFFCDIESCIDLF